MNKMNLKKTPLAIALGVSMAAGMATTANAGENPFGMTELSNGYMQVAAAHMEAKCGGDMKKGEGKCGGSMMKDGEKKMEGKCGEGKCGGMTKGVEKKMEGKCGEGKCGGMTKGVEKKMEGKCGEGKCGGSK